MYSPYVHSHLETTMLPHHHLRGEICYFKRTYRTFPLHLSVPHSVPIEPFQASFPSLQSKSNILENKAHEKDDRSQTVTGTIDLREVYLTDLWAAPRRISDRHNDQMRSGSACS